MASALGSSEILSSYGLDCLLCDAVVRSRDVRTPGVALACVDLVRRADHEAELPVTLAVNGRVVRAVDLVAVVVQRIAVVPVRHDGGVRRHGGDERSARNEERCKCDCHTLSDSGLLGVVLRRLAVDLGDTSVHRTDPLACE